MKNTNFFSIVALLTVIFLSVNAGAFSQGVNWKFGGNNNVGINDWIGSQNNADFSIKTNSLLRINVGKDGTTNFFGKVKLNCDTTVLKGYVKTDTIRLSRILPPDGDSIIYFGSHTVFLNLAANRISWTPVPPCPTCPAWCSGLGIRGLSIGNGSVIGYGLNSIAIGSNTVTTCSATNAIVMGAGIGGTLINSTANSFIVGYGTSPTIFADATGVGINISSHTQALDINGKARVRDLTGTPNDKLVTAENNGTLHSIAFTGSATDVLLGNGTFGPVPGGLGTPWVLGGNTLATVNSANNILGTQAAFDVRLYAGNVQRGLIDHNSGFWEVSTTPFTPIHLLDVKGGDINVNDASGTGKTGYMIGDNYVLYHKGDISNILVGVGAGFSNTGSNCTFVGYNAGNNNSNINNTFIGHVAGFNNIGGYNNTYLGDSAGYTNKIEMDNTFIGKSAGFSTFSGHGNTFVGSLAGYHNQTGEGNVFVGYQAGYNNNDRMDNTFVGNWSGLKNTHGNGNCFFGVYSGQSNTIGNNNVFIGNDCGGGNTSASNNIFMGSLAGAYNTGDNNIFIGNNSGYNNNTGGKGNCYYGNLTGYAHVGNHNTFIGDNSQNPSTPTAGDYNTFVGYNTAYLSSTNPYFFYSSAVGANATVTANYKMILGDNNVDVGIGLSNDQVQFGPQNKLEINTGLNGFNPSLNGTVGASGLRFRDLHDGNTPSSPNSSNTVLSVNNLGDVILVPISGVSGTLAADNGTLIQSPDICTPTNHVELGGPLHKNTEIELQNTTCNPGINNLYFSGQSPTNTLADYILTNVGIGKPMPTTLVAKLDVEQDHGVQMLTPSHENSIGINLLNTFGVLIDNEECIGLKSHLTGDNLLNTAGKFISENSSTNTAGKFIAQYGGLNIGGDFTASAYTAGENYGIQSEASNGAIHNYGIYSTAYGGTNNYGGLFGATNPTGTNYGIDAYATDAAINYGGNFYSAATVTNSTQYGIYTEAYNISTNSTQYGIYADAVGIGTQYGIYTQAFGIGTQYGIYATVSSGTGTNWAGFFVGAVTNTANTWLASDSKLKQNTAPITNALGLISQLQPHTFNFDTVDYSFMNFPSGSQFGLYAEQVDTITPELVRDITFPEQKDSSGNIINPAVSYKGLNYTGFIPILIQGEKELDSAVTVLQNTTPPNMPILVSPADSATNMPLTVTLRWTKSTRVSSYTVYIAPVNSQSANTSAPINNSISSIIINTTDTFVTVTLPNYYTLYNWNVIAYNNAGSSNMSNQWSFTTLMPPLPLAPVLVSPVNSSTGLPLANTFTWNNSATASGYTLYISTDTTYANVVNIVTTGNGTAVGQNSVDTLAYATVPNYKTSYYWWVVAANVSGQSPASVKWNFVTTQPPMPPATPQLASPVNSDTLTVSPFFQWYKSAGASYYTLYVSTTPDNSGIISNSTVVDTFSNVGLAYGHTYYWWVVACNQYSCNTPSNVWHFFIKSMMPLMSAAEQQAATLSDSILKKDVNPLSNAMPLISQLNPVNFYWDTLKLKWLPKTPQIGLIAQQVDRIVPQVVFKDTAGYYNIQYGRLVALLVEGMKEMNAKNDSLKNVVAGYSTRFDSLEAMISRCCIQNQNARTVQPDNTGNSGSQSNVQYVELDMANAIILNQNDPNPFAEETDITYFLPETVGSATIMFYDNTGVIIKVVQLQSKGNGTLHVFASNLSSGIYTYALIVDGKLIDSKKMMKSK